MTDAQALDDAASCGPDFTERAPLVAIVLTSGAGLLLLVMLVNIRPDSSAHALQSGALLGFVGGLLWLAVTCSLGVGPSGLKIRNMLCVYHIPWNSLVGIERRPGLKVIVSGLRAITVVLFQPSPIDSLRGGPRITKVIQQIEGARRTYQDCDSGGQLKWGVNLGGLLPALGVVVSFLLVSVLH